jgi:hypothetical protein
MTEEEIEAKGTELLMAVADAHINLAAHIKNTAPDEVGDVTIEMLLLNDFRAPTILMNTLAATITRLQERRENGEDI